MPWLPEPQKRGKMCFVFLALVFLSGLEHPQHHPDQRLLGLATLPHPQHHQPCWL